MRRSSSQVISVQDELEEKTLKVVNQDLSNKFRKSLSGVR